MKKTIMIIGSSSFSGSWFAKKMIEENFKVIGLSRTKIKKEFSFINPKKFFFHKVDINKNFKNFVKLVEKYRPETIVNFAAQSFVRTSWDTPADWFKTNTLSSIKIAHFLKDKKFLKKFIQISTPEIYGNIKNFHKNNSFNPTTPYALSKLSFDLFLAMLMKKYNFPVIFVRSANVYGEGQQLYRIIPKAIIKIKKKEKLFLNDMGEVYRSFIHISDNSDLIFQIMKNGKIGKTYHPSTDKLISLKDLAKIICKKLNSNYKKLIILKKNKTTDDKHYNIYSSNELKKLNFKPNFISVESGVDRTINWINKNWEIFKKSNLEYKHKK